MHVCNRGCERQRQDQKDIQTRRCQDTAGVLGAAQREELGEVQKGHNTEELAELFFKIGGHPVIATGLQ